MATDIELLNASDIDTVLEGADAPDAGIPESIPTIPGAVKEDMRNLLTGEAAAIERYNTGEDTFSAFDRLISETDPKAVVRQKAAEKSNKDREQITSDFAKAPGQTPEQILEKGQSTITAIKESDKQVNNPHLAYIKAVSDGPVDPEVEKKMANDLHVLEMMRDITDNMGVIDWTTSIGGLMVPGNIIKDNIDISGSAFHAEEFMKNFVLSYKALPSDQQAEILPSVKDWLFDKLENPLKVIHVLETMVQPGGEESLHDFGALWSVLDVADVAVLGAGIAKRIATLTKTMNRIKTARNASNISEASRLNTAAVVDERAATQAGVDQVTAAGNAAPFNLSELDAAYTEGLSSQAVDDLKGFYEDASKVREKLTGNDFFLREGLLDAEDRNSAESLAHLKLLEEEGIENVRVVSRDGNTTTFAYDRIHAGNRYQSRGPGGKFGPMVQEPDTRVGEQFTLDLTLNDVGEYEQNTIGLMSRYLDSPTVWAKGNLKEAVAAAQRLDFAQARVWNELLQFQRKAVSDVLGPLGLKGITPSGRKKLAQLDEVLRVGDELQTVYTANELRAGVNGIKLDDKQIQAYFKMRHLIDNLFWLRNDTKRRELTVRGLKHINLSDSEHAVAKPFVEYDEALGVINTSNPGRIYHQGKGTTVSMSKVDLKREYDAGRVLVKFDTPTRVPGGEGKYNFALVSPDNVMSLPSKVLHYRRGYVPKINLRANYFVKAYRGTTIDGKKIAATDAGAEVETVRAFDNRQDADAFALKMMDEDPGMLYKALEDRQLEKEARLLDYGGDSAHSGGGLYTGARSTEEILFGLDGVPQDRLSSFESISQNLSNISRYISRNEWRMGLQQKAINTAQTLMPNANIRKFNDLASMPDTENGRFLRKLHDQVEDWMGFPTKEEQLWEAMVQHVYESPLGRKLPDFAKKSLQYVRHKDPIAAARSAAFHSLLGWFNPIQMWVQAQGAAVALSHNLLNPKMLGVVLRDQTALAASRYMTRPEQLSHVAKSMGMETDDLVELNRLWVKSGLEDSILTTADHAAASQGRAIGIDALSRASNKALFFYRKGELFNRRASFTTAYRDWKAAHPGSQVDDRALKVIVAKANNFMLNLGKANRASWQKGVFGLPTQFLQVSTKTMETLLGWNGQFTAADRAKIFGSQILLYGAAGIPLGSMGANWLAQAMGARTQSDIEAMDPEVRKAINEGFTGWATMAMFGIDVDVGQRSSLISGINEFTDRILFDDTTIAEAALGAFGTTNQRFWDSMTQLMEPLSLGLAGIKEVDPVKAATLLLEPISSWRNVNKAYFMNQFDRILDSRGRLVMKRDFKFREEIAQAIGFRLSDELVINDLNDAVHANMEYRNQVTDSIVEIFWDYAMKAESDEGLSDDYKESTRNKMALLYQSLPTTYDRNQVRDQVKQRLASGRDKYSQAWQKYRREFSDGRFGELMDWHSRLTSNGILQQQSVGE